MTGTSIRERLRLPEDLRWPPTIAGILFLPVCTLFLGPLVSGLLLIFGIGPFLTGFLPGIITGSATHDNPLRVTMVIGLVTYVLCLTVLGVLYPEALTLFPLSIPFGVILSILGSAAICRMFDWKSEE